jgi:uncharacterized tellurite resistance protein B-like protein
VSLLRFFLGIGEDGKETDSESESVRRIAAELHDMPEDRAHYLAAFAYVLARAANADFRVDDTEVEAMMRATSSLTGVGEAEARTVVEIALSQNQELGASENYIVTREFRRISTREQRIALVECLYAISAADGTISTDESAVVLDIAQELGLARSEANALKLGWKEHLAEFQGLARQKS